MLPIGRRMMNIVRISEINWREIGFCISATTPYRMMAEQRPLWKFDQRELSNVLFMWKEDLNMVFILSQRCFHDGINWDGPNNMHADGRTDGLSNWYEQKSPLSTIVRTVVESILVSYAERILLHFPFFIHALTAKTTLQTEAHAVPIDAVGCEDVPFGGLIGNVLEMASILVGPRELLLSTVKRRKLSWFSHVCRHDTLSKIILQGSVDGRRLRGRPCES